eukprot:TRINITY_DN13041_c0_g1_i1.p1 TRINITY_DN13041_c0_g1~~TRINITY_DN13041_c0_g1_i1.p1  ORF type:complete len:249 (-),score=43.43 TRINITY_DN13041_c0_g1_i1:51-797(-)
MIVITFDVDGTLVRSTGPDANRVHKDAFIHAFQEVFGIRTSLDVISHHGSTDPLILLALADHHGIPLSEAQAKLPELSRLMTEYTLCHRTSLHDGIEVLPGVAKLLEALACQKEKVIFGLVTGNLEPIGWAKMHALGLHQHFTTPNFGGFGSDYCGGDLARKAEDRAEFIRFAQRRAAVLLNGQKIAASFHVGDAPTDVLAAALAGVGPIGVLTGAYNAAQLQDAAPSATVLPDLCDTEKFFALVGLE